jgi:hypothetical protein
MEDIFLLKLYGSLAIDSYAKINIKWLNNVEQYKWYLGKNGYPFAYINNNRIQLHRYIHLLISGYWSTLYIDHIDRDKLNCLNDNLREATPAQNAYNKTYKNPLHNIKHNKSTNKYEVSICKNKQIYKIGDICSLDEAKIIYNLMAENLFGEFAPNN